MQMYCLYANVLPVCNVMLALLSLLDEDNQRNLLDAAVNVIMSW